MTPNWRDTDPLAQTAEHAVLRKSARNASAAHSAYCATLTSAVSVGQARYAKALHNRWRAAMRELAIYEYTDLNWSADRAGREFLPDDILTPADASPATEHILEPVAAVAHIPASERIHDYYRTGIQDCGNAFDGDDVPTAEELAESFDAYHEWDESDSVELRPALRDAWVRGWQEAAAGYVATWKLLYANNDEK